MTQPAMPRQTLQTYHYDALSRITALQGAGRAPTRRFYRGATLVNELQGTTQHSHLYAGGRLLGVRNATSVTLLGTEQQGSVLHAKDDDSSQPLAYTPHGDGADPTLPGFNGEQPDPLTGNYLLGNGYRAYNPVVMRFHSPDSVSPFGEGGLNPYTYCLGDPINRVDPTGHLSVGAWVGIGLGAVLLGMGVIALGAAGIAAGTAVMAGVLGGALPSAAITAAVVGATVAASLTIASGSAAVAAGITSETDPSTSAGLGWTSLGLGIGGALVGGITLAIAGPIQPTLFRWGVEAMRTQGMSGRGAAAAGEAWAQGGGDFIAIANNAPAMEAIVGYLPPSTLTDLIVTSSTMYELTDASLGPIGRIVANLHAARDPAAFGAARRQLLAIGTGVSGPRASALGHLPMQLTRAGVTPETLLYHGPHAVSLDWQRQLMQPFLDAGLNRQNALRARWEAAANSWWRWNDG